MIDPTASCTVGQKNHNIWDRELVEKNICLFFYNKNTFLTFNVTRSLNQSKVICISKYTVHFEIEIIKNALI